MQTTPEQNSIKSVDARPSEVDELLGRVSFVYSDWTIEAKDWNRGSVSSFRMQVVPTLSPGPIAVVGVVIMLGSIVAMVFGSAIGPYFADVVGIITIVAVFGAWVALRPRRESIPAWFESRILPKGTKGGERGALGRVCVLARKPRRLWAVRPMTGEAFEPRVFFVPFSYRGAVWLNVVLYVIVFGVSMVAIWQLKRLLGVGGWSKIRAWDIWAVMGVPSLLATFIYPAYVRIVPGRMDVFRYPMFGRGRPAVESVDLRSGEVIVRADGCAVNVTTPTGPREWTLPVMMFRRDEALRSVLEAAISEHEAPDLTMDALSG
ncbi:MAG: hypothetical protein AB7Q00_05725 [Phycisphaerales bacterium]